MDVLDVVSQFAVPKLEHVTLNENFPQHQAYIYEQRIIQIPFYEINKILIKA